VIPFVNVGVAVPKSLLSEEVSVEAVNVMMTY